MNLLIDGDYMVQSRYRATGGRDQSAQYLIDRTLGGLLDRWKPGVVYIAWDTPDSHLLRLRLVSDLIRMVPGLTCNYKPRDPTIPEIIALKRHMQDTWVEGYHVTSDGEGDDTIAALAHAFDECVVWSADKDFLQLVGPGVTFHRAGTRKSDVIITEENIATTSIRYGSCQVELPSGAHWLALQALAGDPCDNIPGVPGIGPAKARAVLEACPAIVTLLLTDQQDRIVYDPEEKVGRVIRRIIDARWNLALSYALVLLYRNVKIHIH